MTAGAGETSPSAQSTVVEETGGIEESEEENEDEETKSDAEELVSVDLSEVLNVYKQKVSAPPSDVESGEEILGEILKEDNNIKFEDKALDRFIDLGNLNLNQVDVNNAQITELAGIVRSDSFSKSLDQLGDSLDEAINEQNFASQLGVASAAGIVAGVSTGILSQVLRAGSLLASFMSVVPLWRQFDPLPILSAFDDPETGATSDDEDNSEDEDELEEIFDRSAQEDA